jgi:hypothetical protein
MLAKGIRTSRKTLVHRARSPLKKNGSFFNQAIISKCQDQQ